jgi:phage baseplate assembly protein gpV
MNNDFDAFELLKHSPETNFHENLHRVPLISYGVIREAVSVSSVIVDTVVQDQQAQETFSVPLLYPSSALFEHSVYPKRGDLVLLLFVQRFNAAMFDDPLIREQLTGDMTLYDTGADGYTRFSGVGLLMRTPKNNSDITVQHSETDAYESSVLAAVKAALTLTLSRNVSILVDKHPSEGGDPVVASVVYGERAAYEESHYHDARRSYGFKKDIDNDLQELSAPVTEEYSIYAPVTKNVQGAQTTDAGLGADKDGNPVETDAPIAETIHGKAPITRNIRSPQTTIIGIGNEESGDANEQRHAPLDFTLGEDANIALTSKSALTLHFDKAMLIETDDSYDLIVSGPITINGGGEITVVAAGSVTVTGSDITLNGPTTINGETTINGACDISGAASVGAALDVTGSVSAAAAAIAGSVSMASGSAGGKAVATSGSSVTVSGVTPGSGTASGQVN